MFHETTLLEKRGKLGGGDEEVIHIIDFTRSWLPRRMEYGEAKYIRICVLKLLEQCALPTPEGPEMTISRES